jgi:hypothetical protein
MWHLASARECFSDRIKAILNLIFLSIMMRIYKQVIVTYYKNIEGHFEFKHSCILWQGDLSKRLWPIIKR